jgi:hypothetical protein
MRFDGLDFLNGKVKLPRANTPCINADLSVVAWSTEQGIYEVGHGVTVEGARAIARLHSGHDDYIQFDEPFGIVFRAREAS